MQCQACGTETMMPFRCPYCGGQFCSAHRLPENHACPRIDHAKTDRKGQVMTQQGYGTYNYSYVYGQQPFKRQYRIRFSQVEVKHIGIAAALVIGIGVSMALYENIFGGFYPAWTWDMIGLFAAFLTASFLTHEIAHKVAAQKVGLWAEFRLTTFGAVLTLVSVFLPFKMIAPGAMMIGGQAPSAKALVKISIAGVIMNMIFAVTFLGLAFGFNNAYSSMLAFTAYLNAFMALFNLVPFGVLDGYKIFALNKKVWITAFIPAAILTAFIYWLLFI